MESIIKATRNAFVDWNLFEISWLTTFSLLNIYFYLHNITLTTTLAFSATFAGLINVILAAKGKAVNFIPGGIRSSLYALLAFQSMYYGEFIINLFFFFPMQIYGFITWRKKSNSNSNSSIKINTLSIKTKLIGSISSIICIYFYSLFLVKIGTKEPLLNSISTMATILAVILMTRRYMEHWILWTVTNLAAIYLWIIALQNGNSNISILIMFIAFTINGLYGFYNWNKLSKTQIS